MAKGSKSSKSLKNLKSLSNSISSVNNRVTNTINPLKTNPMEEIKNNSGTMTGVFILYAMLFIINFAINLYALLWIQKLEEISCKCSENWKRDYIKYFLYIYFIVSIIQFITFLATGHGLEGQNSGILSTFSILYSGVALAAMFVAVFYIDELKQKQCSCSEDIRREVYYYYNIIRLALFGLTFLMMLITMIFVGSMLSRLALK